MTCKLNTRPFEKELQPRLTNLSETGRIHYFYNSPKSKLPVRDILNDRHHGSKTEPYIEKSAENWCRRCIQMNIRGFIKSSEKYLFFMTRKEKRYIVGYLIKKRAILRGSRQNKFYAVQGKIKLVAYRNAFPFDNLNGIGKATRGFCKLNKTQTNCLLKHFKKHKNIYNDCLKEVRRLKLKL